MFSSILSSLSFLYNPSTSKQKPTSSDQKSISSEQNPTSSEKPILSEQISVSSLASKNFFGINSTSVKSRKIFNNYIAFGDSFS
ncbi:18686_t:CDS:1, partial [Dentiscutata erythropus]